LSIVFGKRNQAAEILPGFRHYSRLSSQVITTTVSKQIPIAVQIGDILLFTHGKSIFCGTCFALISAGFQVLTIHSACSSDVLQFAITDAPVWYIVVSAPLTGNPSATDIIVAEKIQTSLLCIAPFPL
jgi:hypothetical protein